VPNQSAQETDRPSSASAKKSERPKMRVHIRELPQAAAGLLQAADDVGDYPPSVTEKKSAQD
jgi:hypothetical protein